MKGKIHGHRTAGKPSRTYGSWDAMKKRCSDPNRKDYPQYGGRGIFVEDFLKSFRNFLSYMGERPTRMTLDRLDNDGPYCRGNIRWATKAQQSQRGLTRQHHFA